MNRREFISSSLVAAALVTGSLVPTAKAVSLPDISTEAQAKAAMHRSMRQASYHQPSTVRRVVIKHINQDQFNGAVHYLITDARNCESTWFSKAEGRPPMTTFELPFLATCYFDVGDIIVLRTDYFGDVLGKVVLAGMYDTSLMASHKDVVNSL